MKDSQFELISAYLDGELVGDELHAAEKLLRESPEAARVLAEMESMRSQIRSIPQERLPSSFASEVAKLAFSQQANLGSQVESKQHAGDAISSTSTSKLTSAKSSPLLNETSPSNRPLPADIAKPTDQASSRSNQVRSYSRVWAWSTISGLAALVLIAVLLNQPADNGTLSGVAMQDAPVANEKRMESRLRDQARAQDSPAPASGIVAPESAVATQAAPVTLGRDLSRKMAANSQSGETTLAGKEQFNLAPIDPPSALSFPAPGVMAKGAPDGGGEKVPERQDDFGPGAGIPLPEQKPLDSALGDSAVGESAETERFISVTTLEVPADVTLAKLEETLKEAIPEVNFGSEGLARSLEEIRGSDPSSDSVAIYFDSNNVAVADDLEDKVLDTLQGRLDAKPEEFSAGAVGFGGMGGGGGFGGGGIVGGGLGAAEVAEPTDPDARSENVPPSVPGLPGAGPAERATKPGGPPRYADANGQANQGSPGEGKTSRMDPAPAANQPAPAPSSGASKFEVGDSTGDVELKQAEMLKPEEDSQGSPKNGNDQTQTSNVENKEKSTSAPPGSGGKPAEAKQPGGGEPSGRGGRNSGSQSPSGENSGNAAGGSDQAGGAQPSGGAGRSLTNQSPGGMEPAQTKKTGLPGAPTRRGADGEGGTGGQSPTDTLSDLRLTEQGTRNEEAGETDRDFHLRFLSQNELRELKAEYDRLFRIPSDLMEQPIVTLEGRPTPDTYGANEPDLKLDRTKDEKEENSNSHADKQAKKQEPKKFRRVVVLKFAQPDKSAEASPTADVKEVTPAPVPAPAGEEKSDK